MIFKVRLQLDFGSLLKKGITLPAFAAGMAGGILGTLAAGVVLTAHCKRPYSVKAW